MKIVTHNAKFHTDDVFAVATLLIKYPNAEIVRTRDDDVVGKADIVVDIGYVYDPENNRFDHHQDGGAGKREDGVPYSSFGLVWKKFGEELCGSAILAERIDRILVQPIDAPDNGMSISTEIIPGIRPYFIQGVVSSYRLTWKEEGESWDDRFLDCVKWAKQFIQRQIKIGQDIVEGELIAMNAYENASDKRIVLIDEPYSLGRELVNKVLSDLPDTLYAVLYRDDHRNWQVLSLSKNPGSFELKKPLPESWRSKRDVDLDVATGISGGVFCHRTGFMCVTNTKEQALKLAEIALNA